MPASGWGHGHSWVGRYFFLAVVIGETLVQTAPHIGDVAEEEGGKRQRMIIGKTR